MKTTAGLALTGRAGRPCLGGQARRAVRGQRGPVDAGRRALRARADRGVAGPAAGAGRQRFTVLRARRAEDAAGHRAQLVEHRHPGLADSGRDRADRHGGQRQTGNQTPLGQAPTPPTGRERCGRRAVQLLDPGLQETGELVVLGRRGPATEGVKQLVVLADAIDGRRRHRRPRSSSATMPRSRPSARCCATRTAPAVIPSA